MNFEFDDRGTGPALLFFPGSYSTASAWRGVQKALSGSYRLMSTSLPGYGATPEMRSLSDSTIDRMTDFVAQVVSRAGEPVHLVGHSFGGLSLFAAVLHQKVSAESLITFEANPVVTRPVSGEYPWVDHVRNVSHQFETAHINGDTDAAGIIIDYWSKAGTFDALPEAVKSHCRQTAGANVLDWRAALSFSPFIAEYAAMTIPTTLVRGEHANPAIIGLSAEIADQIEHSRLEVVSGADHFLISTHPEACAAVIDRHMQNVLA